MRTLARLVAALSIAVAMIVASATSQAAEKVNFILNWVPGADHAPYFYARAQGWYEDAGLEVKIDPERVRPCRANVLALVATTLALPNSGRRSLPKARAPILLRS